MITVEPRFYVRPLLAAVFCTISFCGGAYLARASSSGATAAYLSYSGVLQRDAAPVTGTQSLSFIFNKGGTEACHSPTLQVTADVNGRFQVSIPMANCPQSLFDGSAVTVDIVVAGQVAAKGVHVSPVPYAVHADQLGTSDCPSGYDRDLTPSAVATAVGCVRGNDHVVRVGNGATAFWIDRYEASIWKDPGALGQQYGAGTDFPATFPPNGQAAPDAQLYAVSKVGVLPSISMTWFQADRACRASGKRLPTNEEWSEAAWGTPDGVESDAGPCHTSTSATNFRPTGGGARCVSNWGAEDMVGNAAEVVSDWALGANAPGGVVSVTQWPAGFGSGQMWDVTSTAAGGATGPLEISRGGAVWDAAASTVFAVAATQTVAQPADGFRCVVPR